MSIVNEESFEIDWETLAKRLIAANQMGFRLEQSDGHRWIAADVAADFMPACFADMPRFTKNYGSYKSALDSLDIILRNNSQPSLLEQWPSINYFDNLGVIFGKGTQ